ncbi:peptidase [Sulfurirhabdus autotrophica]|uniref:Putative proteasome-type protease n=1 Tax=Sulfurirhabdus autotrophica TaxID=1706046 RepID=A0A4R3XPE9_9PROT|nr:peptidase [Sulfurirhabdus autotrophica]TCV79278.1 putative proteasome-type protease [Sulfurirhabdus autotrophica]
MTYCLAIKVKEGLVFASDSRTNAGVDHVSTYSKMHNFSWPGKRSFVLLSSGNLATTQAVVKKIRTDAEDATVTSLRNVSNMDAAVNYVGKVSADIQRAQAERDTAKSNFEATFLFGGQISGHESGIFLIYPQGNFIHESAEQPFLQVGETKYGKPILDRVIRPDTQLELAGRCAIVSINSTIRSNLTVGPPIELLLYTNDSLNEGRHLTLAESDPFYQTLSDAWSEGLRHALNGLPPFEWEQQLKTAQVVQETGPSQVMG